MQYYFIISAIILSERRKCIRKKKQNSSLKKLQKGKNMTNTELEVKLKSIEKKLKELKEILDTDSEEFTKILNKDHRFKHTFTESDTYPYRIGVASSKIEFMLEIIQK